jgi:Tol biopolymer transport system component
MGEVWRARDTRLNRDVAIKFSSQQFTDRFEREARAIAALNHPNICTLFDVGPNYLVMELIDGPTLADRIAEGPIPLEEALAIARQIADALEAAHERGIVHRDLKPGNIKIRPDGSVKVLDFGLAKTGGEEQQSVTLDSPTIMHMPTQAGVILGTAAYMAPEQARGKTVDRRADIWSFGVVLYEMLTGKRLFQGEDLTDTLAAVVRSEPDLTAAPAELCPLLAKCLQKDPKHRLRDIGDWELLTQAAPAGSSKPGRPLAWMLAAVVAIAGCVALAAIHFRETLPQSPVMRTEILPPAKTTFPGAAFNAGLPALSPDGRLLAFGAIAEDGHSQLYVRALDALAAQPLAGTEGASYPFWSPDSHTIGFGANGKLKKIDAAGGPAVELADAPNFGGGTWSQDGVIVFAPNGQGLQKIPAAGGPTVPVTSFLPGDRVHFWPWFLPDGRHFLYTASVGGAVGAGDIRIGSVDANERGGAVGRVLGKAAASQAVFSQGHLLFQRGQTLMAQAFDVNRLDVTGEAVPVAENIATIAGSARAPFAVSSTGLLVYQAGASTANLGLVWFDRSGKRTGVGGEPGNLFQLHLSPDRRLAAVALGVPRDIWIYDLPRGLRSRFTFGPGSQLEAIWSPDGKTLVFCSNRSGHYDLYRKAVNGTGTDELLYTDDQQKYPTSWSPDGKYLLYHSGSIFALPLTPNAKPIPFTKNAFVQQQAQFSPDGRWVAYQSNESGRFEVYVAPFPGPGGKRQVSATGGTLPRWRADGKELFYLTQDQRLMAADIALKPDAAEVGAVHALFKGLLAGSTFRYDVSADGQHFLGIVPQEESGGVEPLVLVQNWPTGLKK